MKQIHHAESADQGNGHRQRGNQRRANVAQKNEHHQNHQGDRDAQRAFHVPHRFADDRRPVDGVVHVDRRGHFRLQRRHRLVDALHGVDQVGAGLAENQHQHRALLVGEPGHPHVLHGVLHVGHVGEPHRRAVVVADGQVPVIARLHQLIVREDVRGRALIGNLALRQVGVLLAQHVAHVLQPEAVAAELRGVQLDAHGRQRPSVDHHLPHARNLRKPLLQDRRRRVEDERHVVNVRRQRQIHHRNVRRIDFPVDRIGRHIRGKKTAGGVDGGLHVARGAVDVAVDVELHGDVGRSEIARRGHFRHARDAPELAFERRGHRRRHILGAAPRQIGLHRNRREIHLRQRRHGKLAESHRPGKRDRRHHQRRCHRPMNKNAQESHESVDEKSIRPVRAPSSAAQKQVSRMDGQSSVLGAWKVCPGSLPFPHKWDARTTARWNIYVYY